MGSAGSLGTRLPLAVVHVDCTQEATRKPHVTGSASGAAGTSVMSVLYETVADVGVRDVMRSALVGATVVSVPAEVCSTQSEPPWFLQQSLIPVVGPMSTSNVTMGESIMEASACDRA